MKKLLSVAAAIVMVTSLGACTVEIGNPDLKEELTNDPVMSMSYEGMTEISRLVEADSEDNGPMMVRCMQVADGADVQELISNVINYGQTEGWDHRDSKVLDTNTSQLALKTDKFDNELTMMVGTDGIRCNSEEGNVLTIAISY